MKFGKQLDEEKLPEWEQYYFPYRSLKKRIDKIRRIADAEASQTETSPSEDGPSVRSLHPHVAAGGEDGSPTSSGDDVLEHNEVASNETIPESKVLEIEFLNDVRTSAQSVNAFYTSKVDEYQGRLQKLSAQVRLLHQERGGALGLKRRLKKRKLQKAFKLFMLDLDRLKTYSRLNFSAVRKILKKFDKQLVTGVGLETLASVQGTLHFRLHLELDTIINCSTALYGAELMNDLEDEDEAPIEPGEDGVSIAATGTISAALHKSASMVINRQRKSSFKDMAEEVDDVIKNAAMHSRSMNKKNVRWRNGVKSFRRKKKAQPQVNIADMKKKWLHNVFEHIHHKKQKATRWVPFWIGFCACALVLLSIFLAGNVSSNEDVAKRDEIVMYVPAFRMVLLPTVLMLMFAGNRYVWKKYNVNDRVIFQSDPYTRLSVTQLMVVQLFSLTFLIIFANLVFSTLTGQIDISDEGQAMLTTMIGVYILVLVVPLPRMYRTSRTYILYATWRAALAPLYRVRFVDFWLADQWTSLSRALVDGARVACYYSNGLFTDASEAAHCFTEVDDKRNYVVPLVSAFPYWVRWWQCIRRFRDDPSHTAHMWNMGKYTFGLLIITFSALSKRDDNRDWAFIVWVIVSVVGTGYSIFWDIHKDWGLTLFSLHHYRKSPHWPLREPSKMLYPRWWYYLATVSNIILRLGWVFTISPRFFGIELSAEVLTTTLSLFGVLRRGVWNIFRVENEHVNNVGKFRAELHIELPFSESEVDKEIDDFNAEFSGLDGMELDIQDALSEGTGSDEESSGDAMEPWRRASLSRDRLSGESPVSSHYESAPTIMVVANVAETQPVLSRAGERNTGSSPSTCLESKVTPLDNLDAGVGGTPGPYCETFRIADFSTATNSASSLHS